MKKRIQIVLSASVLSLLPLSLYASSLPPLKTMPSVNLAKYMGKWYEIASLPNHFQKGCRCTTATYSIDGKAVKVHNQCYKGKDLKYSDATAKAWSVNPPYNSKLKVSFFWPFTGNYWILYVDRAYRIALVGTPDRKYLWILSRTKTISKAQYNKLIKIAKAQGFQLDQFNMTDQACPFNY